MEEVEGHLGLRIKYIYSTAEKDQSPSLASKHKHVSVSSNYLPSLRAMVNYDEAPDPYYIHDRI